MDPRERELLTGMGNCYAACHADFDGTVQMVADARGRTPDEVRRTLVRLRTEFGGTAEFEELRRRLPSAFPF